MKYRILIALFAIGLGAHVLAEEKPTYPQVSFIGPSSGKKPVPRDQFVLLVVEGSYLSYESQPIAAAGAVDYVNKLLKIKNVSYIGVHPREGVKYGDVVRAIDVLRKTDAKNIGVSTVELAAGREP